VTQKSDSVVEVRRNVQQLTKDALGNLSPEDVRSINFTLQGKSLYDVQGMDSSFSGCSSWKVLNTMLVTKHTSGVDQEW